MTLAAVASSSPSLRAEDPRTTGATALSLIDTTMPASATATTVADPRASVSSNDAATAARNTEDVTYSQLSPLTTASARFDALTDSILNNAEEPAAQTSFLAAGGLDLLARWLSESLSEYRLTHTRESLDLLNLLVDVLRSLPITLEQLQVHASRVKPAIQAIVQDVLQQMRAAEQAEGSAAPYAVISILSAAENLLDHFSNLSSDLEAEQVEDATTPTTASKFEGFKTKTEAIDKVVAHKEVDRPSAHADATHMVDGEKRVVPGVAIVKAQVKQDDESTEKEAVKADESMAATKEEEKSPPAVDASAPPQKRKKKKGGIRWADEEAAAPVSPTKPTSSLLSPTAAHRSPAVSLSSSTHSHTLEHIRFFYRELPSTHHGILSAQQLQQVKEAMGMLMMGNNNNANNRNSNANNNNNNNQQGRRGNGNNSMSGNAYMNARVPVVRCDRLLDTYVAYELRVHDTAVQQSMQQRGSASTEKDIQAQRERQSMARHYLNAKQIPPSPELITNEQADAQTHVAGCSTQTKTIPWEPVITPAAASIPVPATEEKPSAVQDMLSQLRGMLGGAATAAGTSTGTAGTAPATTGSGTSNIESLLAMLAKGGAGTAAGTTNATAPSAISSLLAALSSSSSAATTAPTVSTTTSASLPHFPPPPPVPAVAGSTAAITFPPPTAVNTLTPTTAAPAYSSSFPPPTAAPTTHFPPPPPPPPTASATHLPPPPAVTATPAPFSFSSTATGGYAPLGTPFTLQPNPQATASLPPPPPPPPPSATTNVGYAQPPIGSTVYTQPQQSYASPQPSGSYWSGSAAPTPHTSTHSHAAAPVATSSGVFGQTITSAERYFGKRGRDEGASGGSDGSSKRFKAETTPARDARENIPDYVIPPHHLPFKSRRVCTFWPKGNCLSGLNCGYLHVAGGGSWKEPPVVPSKQAQQQAYASAYAAPQQQQQQQSYAAPQQTQRTYTTQPQTQQYQQSPPQSYAQSQQSSYAAPQTSYASPQTQQYGSSLPPPPPPSAQPSYAQPHTSYAASSYQQQPQQQQQQPYAPPQSYPPPSASQPQQQQQQHAGWNAQSMPQSYAPQTTYAQQPPQPQQPYAPTSYAQSSFPPPTSHPQQVSYQQQQQPPVPQLGYAPPQQQQQQQPTAAYGYAQQPRAGGLPPPPPPVASAVPSWQQQPQQQPQAYGTYR